MAELEPLPLFQLPGAQAAALTSLGLAPALDNHLRDARAAEGLGADEVLALEAGKSIADGSQGEEDATGDERGRPSERAQENDDGHDEIDGGTDVVGGDPADEAVELARGRADAEEEGHLDEEDDEGEGPGGKGSVSAARDGERAIARPEGQYVGGLTEKGHRK